MPDLWPLLWFPTGINWVWDSLSFQQFTKLDFVRLSNQTRRPACSQDVHNFLGLLNVPECLSACGWIRSFVCLSLATLYFLSVMTCAHCFLVGKFQSKLMWYMKLYKKKSFTNLKCQELFKAEVYTIFICCSHAIWTKKNNPSLLMSCLNTFSRQTAYHFYISINSFRHPCLNYCAISAIYPMFSC